MNTWKLSQSLTKPKDPEWELLSQFTLSDNVHSDRKESFLLSRQALMMCLQELGLTLTPLELKLEKFHKIKGLERFTISLCHTKNAGAAFVAERKEVRSLGIDVEHEDRLMKDSIRQRIAHHDDTSLRNIELWCIKEAVFKTLMNTDLFEHPIEFSSIAIKNKRWAHPPSGLEGAWELEVLRPFVVARAVLKV